jgi:hypothetical protein
VPRPLRERILGCDVVRAAGAHYVADYLPVVAELEIGR